MTFSALLNRMATAACAGDGLVVAACFTDEGIYHDCFYGPFQGTDNIANLIENHFHRDAENFRWDLHEPVENHGIGYARYVFSYRSKLPDWDWRAVSNFMFGGTALAKPGRACPVGITKTTPPVGASLGEEIA
jgi:hypothetical protein